MKQEFHEIQDIEKRNVEDRTANFKLHFLLNYLVLDDLPGFYFFGIENLTQSYITDT